eukprot:93710-Chlamydomonas_euryale.AAC.1
MQQQQPLGGGGLQQHPNGGAMQQQQPLGGGGLQLHPDDGPRTSSSHLCVVSLGAHPPSAEWIRQYEQGCTVRPYFPILPYIRFA